jgi:hypothetical protein
MSSRAFPLGKAATVHDLKKLKLLRRRRLPWTAAAYRSTCVAAHPTYGPSRNAAIRAMVEIGLIASERGMTAQHQRGQ